MYADSCQLNYQYAVIKTSRCFLFINKINWSLTRMLCTFYTNTKTTINLIGYIFDLVQLLFMAY